MSTTWHVGTGDIYTTLSDYVQTAAGSFPVLTVFTHKSHKYEVFKQEKAAKSHFAICVWELQSEILMANTLSECYSYKSEIIGEKKPNKQAAQ